MRTSTLVTLLVVGGSGVAAFVLAYGYLGQQPDPNAGKIRVLCALQNVNRGDTLELAKNVDFKLFAPTDLPEEALVQEEKLVNDLQNQRYIALASMKRNDMLRKTTAGTNRDSLIEQKLKDRPDYRAYSIQVSTDRAVAGFIKPGSYVDLIWTGRIDGKRELTRTMLQNVEVAAVDLENTVGTDQKGKEVRYMTFIVTQRQAPLLAFASKTGQLSASLRTAGSENGEKNLANMDWNTFQSELDGGKHTTGQPVDAEDQKSMASDAMSLLNIVDAALKAPKVEAVVEPTAIKVVSAPQTVSRTVWYIFEVKNIEGKIVSTVPVSAESEFAKKNRGMLRSPEPDELESIARMPRDSGG